MATKPRQRKAAVSKPEAPSVSLFSVAGSTGLRRSGGFLDEEFHRNLKGSKGVKVYREIADNEATIGGALLAMETLVRQAPWTTEPANESPEAHRVAERVDLARNDMVTKWSELVSEVMSSVVFGWAAFEKIYKICRGNTHPSPMFTSKHNDGWIGWRDLAIRSQDSLFQWEFDEVTDTPIAMIQQAPPHYRLQRIPMSKLLLFRMRSAKKSPEGRSMLRNAAQSFWYVRRLREFEGIGAEKDMAGTPDMQIPLRCFTPGASPAEAALRTHYESILPKMRRGEYESIVRPSELDEKGQPTGYKFQLVQSGGRRPVDLDTMIKRYESRMLVSLLAEFMVLGLDGVGSNALSSDKTSLFANSLGAILDSICEVFNDDAIPEMCRLNGVPQELYPSLHHGDIESRNIAEAMTFISQGLQSGALVTGPALEAYARELANIPMEEEGAAETSTLPGFEELPDTQVI